MCANFQAKRTSLTFLAQICLKMDVGVAISKNLSLHSKSAPSLYHVYQFSVKMDSFKFFGLNLGKLPNYVRYFGSNNVADVAESWVVTDMSWMGLDGGRWSCVEVNGLLIPNFNMLVKKHIAQSNDGIYVTIPHLDLGGNDVVHKLDRIRRSRFYIQVHPTVLRVLLQKSCSILYRLPQSKHRATEKGILYFLLFSSDTHWL